MKPVARNRAPRLCPPGSHPSRLESPTGTVRVWLGVSLSPLSLPTYAPTMSPAHRSSQFRGANIPCTTSSDREGPPTVTVIHRDYGPVCIHWVLCIRLQSLDPGPRDITDVTTSHNESLPPATLFILPVSILPKSVLPATLYPCFPPHRIHPSGHTVSVLSATLHPFSGPMNPFSVPHLPVSPRTWCIPLALISTHFSLEAECPCAWDLRDLDLFLALI